MERKIVYLFIVLFGIIVLLVVLRGDEDTWLCKDGKWQKHGNPTAQMPDRECK